MVRLISEGHREGRPPMCEARPSARGRLLDCSDEILELCRHKRRVESVDPARRAAAAWSVSTRPAPC